MPMRMFYHPEPKRSYVGFNLDPKQLRALDKARLAVRLSRSEFLRQMLSNHLIEVKGASKRSAPHRSRSR